MAAATTRMLAALELLQARGRITGAELAAHLGVHPRTVRRYIAALEDMGIPIATERGRHGAYLLVTGFKLPPMMFTEDETLAISLGLVAARHLGLPEAAPATASAQAKLERVMPEALKARVRAGSETISMDFGGPMAPASAPSAGLIGAALERRRARIGYRSSTGEVTEREFDPYGLVYRERRWYVVGHCHLRGALRSLRLDRVQMLDVLDDRFDKPQDFDAGAHLAATLASMPHTHTVEVFLETDMRTALACLHGDYVALEPADGGVVLRAGADCLDWFATVLARLPCPFRVIAPDDLRDAVRHCAMRLLRGTGEAERSMA